MAGKVSDEITRELARKSMLKSMYEAMTDAGQVEFMRLLQRALKYRGAYMGSPSVAHGYLLELGELIHTEVGVDLEEYT